MGGGLAHERSPSSWRSPTVRRRGGSYDQLMAAKGFGHDRCMSQFRSGAAPAGGCRSPARSSPGRARRGRYRLLGATPALASGEGFGLQPLKLRLVDRAGVQ
jgi:hypothetical protein